MEQQEGSFDDLVSLVESLPDRSDDVMWPVLDDYDYEERD